MTEKRKFAINACSELESFLSKYDFKLISKGLCYKRNLTNDISQEIKFNIQRYSLIRVSLSVSSKKIKKWNKENTFLENGYLFFEYNISNITPLKQDKYWEISTSEIAKKQFIKEITALIEEYVIPFFEKFNNLELFINELIKHNESKWTKYSDNKIPDKLILEKLNIKLT